MIMKKPISDNALQNYLDNDSYCNKFKLLNFFNSEIALCTNVFVCFV